MTTPATHTGRIDRLTLVAIALVAYAITNLAHEGLGHGGACVLDAGKPVELNAIYFDCNLDQVGRAGAKWNAAAGTLVNLVLGALFAVGLRFARHSSVRTRYFLWLSMALNLFQATGYWLFSGLAKIGDWAVVVEGWQPAWLWRAGLAVTGAAGYYLVIVLALRTLQPLLGGGDSRDRAAKTLTLLPYLAGGLLYVAAGLLNPVSFQLVLISAAAASFGATSALAWMTSMMSDHKKYPVPDGPPLVMARSIPWLIAGVVVALVFVVVLGRTLRI